MTVSPNRSKTERARTKPCLACQPQLCSSVLPKNSIKSRESTAKVALITAVGGKKTFRQHRNVTIVHKPFVGQGHKSQGSEKMRVQEKLVASKTNTSNKLFKRKIDNEMQIEEPIGERVNDVYSTKIDQPSARSDVSSRKYFPFGDNRAQSSQSYRQNTEAVFSRHPVGASCSPFIETHTTNECRRYSDGCRIEEPANLQSESRSHSSSEPSPRISNLVRALDRDLQKLRHELQTRLEIGPVQDASVQTSKSGAASSNRNNVTQDPDQHPPTLGYFDGLDTYFPNLFGEPSENTHMTFRALPFSSQVEDLWECLREAEDRQRMLDHNLEIVAMKNRSQEISDLVDTHPFSPTTFSEKMFIKQKIDKYISSVRPAVLAAVKEHLNEEKQMKTSKSSTTVNKAPLNRLIQKPNQRSNNRVSRQCQDTKKQTTVQLSTMNSACRRAPVTKPIKNTPGRLASKAEHAVISRTSNKKIGHTLALSDTEDDDELPYSLEQGVSSTLWNERRHRPVYGNLLGLGKQVRDARPYLHLRNPVAKTPVPWPPSSPSKKTGADEYKRTGSAVTKKKPNMVIPAMSVAVSRQSTSTTEVVNDRSSESSNAEKGKSQVKPRPKQRVTFADEMKQLQPEHVRHSDEGRPPSSSTSELENAEEIGHNGKVSPKLFHKSSLEGSSVTVGDDIEDYLSAEESTLESQQTQSTSSSEAEYSQMSEIVLPGANPGSTAHPKMVNTQPLEDDQGPPMIVSKPQPPLSTDTHTEKDEHPNNKPVVEVDNEILPEDEISPKYDGTCQDETPLTRRSSNGETRVDISATCINSKEADEGADNSDNTPCLS